MIKNKLNKKADMTPEEALKIILAVLGIVFLLYLAFSFYGIFMSSTKLDQSRAVLDSMISKASILTLGSNTSILITSPEDWTLYVYNKSEISPKSCANSACICICEEYFNPGKISQAVASCDKSGICQKINLPVVVNTPGLDKTFSFTSLPRIIYVENKDGVIYLTSSANQEAMKVVNDLTSSEEMKSILVASTIHFSNENKTILREEINKTITGGHWDLQVNVDSKRELSLISEDWNLLKSDDQMAYSILLNYAPFTASFTQDNKVYTIELRVAQYE
jgi:hypothetical protein